MLPKLRLLSKQCSYSASTQVPSQKDEASNLMIEDVTMCCLVRVTAHSADGDRWLRISVAMVISRGTPKKPGEKLFVHHESHMTSLGTELEDRLST
jgi:hypothetical protein